MDCSLRELIPRHPWITNTHDGRPCNWPSALPGEDNITDNTAMFRHGATIRRTGKGGRYVRFTLEIDSTATVKTHNARVVFKTRYYKRMVYTPSSFLDTFQEPKSSQGGVAAMISPRRSNHLELSVSCHSCFLYIETLNSKK